MAVLTIPVTPVVRRFATRWWLLVALFTGLASGLFGQTVSKEYQVKAVFLFNFAQFVEWPAAAFPSPQAPLVIGVLGEDPFGAFLDETVRGEKIGARELVVRRFRRAEEITECHILFIGKLSAPELTQALTTLRTRSILTVGENEGFATGGGVIRFLTENNKIRLRINLDAAKRAGLTISSKLLRPAEIVGDAKP